MKSNLEIIKECDVFPYADTEPEAYQAAIKSLYSLVWIQGTEKSLIGYVPDYVVDELSEVPLEIRGEITVDTTNRTISVFQQSAFEERSRVVAAVMNYWRTNKTFSVLAGWRNELYPIYGPGDEHLYDIERSAAALLGVVTYGVHLTGYVLDSSAPHGIKIWVPRRAANKQTYPSMLDNTVAGGMASGEDPVECILRECEEEASLPEALVRPLLRPQGASTYLYVRDARAGGETGLIQPEVEYLYDLELPTEVLLKPNDSEVQAFYLWTVDEVRDHLAKGEFKPNCSLVIIDFLIRRGVLTRENEPNIDEINRRIHRDLVLPGPYRAFLKK